MSIDLSVNFASRFCEQKCQDAEVALLTGSRARGTESDQSDYDVLLIFRSLLRGAWREMVRFEGKYVEIFAHDLNTLWYFCTKVDQAAGIPALPLMVTEGIPVLLKASDLLKAARKLASVILAEGPPALTEENLRIRRFAITDLAEALKDSGSSANRLAIGTALYPSLADFALRADRHWSASGKALPRALARASSDLAQRFETSFHRLFMAGDGNQVQDLVDAVLRPHGGRLRDGFRQEAPAEWRIPASQS